MAVELSVNPANIVNNSYIYKSNIQCMVVPLCAEFGRELWKKETPIQPDLMAFSVNNMHGIDGWGVLISVQSSYHR